MPWSPGKHVWTSTHVFAIFSNNFKHIFKKKSAHAVPQLTLLIDVLVVIAVAVVAVIFDFFRGGRRAPWARFACSLATRGISITSRT
jgi:hypothetical protein